MIIGTRECLSAYRGISANLDAAIDYLLTFDPATPEGTYEIDGKKVYAKVIHGNTKPLNEIKFEAHMRYIDLQYVLEGEEDFVYAPVEDCTAITEYDQVKDIYFLSGEGKTIKMKQNEFYLVHPFDAHQPMCSKNPAPVKKVVIKVLV